MDLTPNNYVIFRLTPNAAFVFRVTRITSKSRAKNAVFGVTPDTIFKNSKYNFFVWINSEYDLSVLSFQMKYNVLNSLTMKHL